MSGVCRPICRWRPAARAAGSAIVPRRGCNRLRRTVCLVDAGADVTVFDLPEGLAVFGEYGRGLVRVEPVGDRRIHREFRGVLGVDAERFVKRLIDNAGIATQSSQPQFGEMYKELMNAINNSTAGMSASSR